MSVIILAVMMKANVSVKFKKRGTRVLLFAPTSSWVKLSVSINERNSFLTVIISQKVIVSKRTHV